MSVFADLRRRRADAVISRDYEGLRGVVLTSVRGQLARKGIELPDAELDAAYNVAWQGLYAQLLEGDEIKNPAGFLVTVTSRRAIDEFRRLHVTRRADDVEVGDHGHDPDLAARLDDYTKLQHFIEGLKDRLDQRERQAVTLCYIQGLSRKEAAEVLGLAEKRMDKVMDGLASRIGEFVRAIESGLWCEERGSLMRAYALHILSPEGERHALAREHLAACSGCRAYVRSLRGLAAAMPPVALPIGGGGGGAAGFFDHLEALVGATRDTVASIAHASPAEVVVGGGGGAAVGTATVAGTGSGGALAGAAGGAAATAVAGGGAAIGTTGGAGIGAAATGTATGAVGLGAAAGVVGSGAAGGGLGAGLAAKAAAIAVSVAVAGTATVTHERANDPPRKAAQQRTVQEGSIEAAADRSAPTRRASVRASGSTSAPASGRSTGSATDARLDRVPSDEFGFEVAARAATPRRANVARATEFGFEMTAVPGSQRRVVAARRKAARTEAASSAGASAAPTPGDPARGRVSGPARRADPAPPTEFGGSARAAASTAAPRPVTSSTTTSTNSSRPAVASSPAPASGEFGFER